jgi:hypothetical protein
MISFVGKGTPVPAEYRDNPRFYNKKADQKTSRPLGLERGQGPLPNK